MQRVQLASGFVAIPVVSGAHCLAQCIHQRSVRRMLVAKTLADVNPCFLEYSPSHQPSFIPRAAPQAS